MMTPILENPLEQLLLRLKSAAPRWIIGMAGLPGAGKSTLASALANEVNAATAPDTMIALGMDGFHLTRAELRLMPDPAEALARRGAPWTFDTISLSESLQALRQSAGRSAVEWPGFQHDVGDPVPGACTVSPATRLILVEGLYLLCREPGWEIISDFFDERWYLDTPLPTAMQRLAQRHIAAWGITREEADRRIAANDGLNAEIVFQSRVHADWRLVSLPAA